MRQRFLARSLHHLETPGVNGNEPTRVVNNAFRQHPTLLYEALPHGLDLALFEVLDDHEQGHGHTVYSSRTTRGAFVAVDRLYDDDSEEEGLPCDRSRHRLSGQSVFRLAAITLRMTGD